MSDTKTVRSITEAPSYAAKHEADARAERAMYRRRRIGAGLVVAAGVTLGAIGVSNGVDAIKGQDLGVKAEGAVEAHPEVLNATVILREGAKLRSTPTIDNGDRADGSTSNVVSTIGAGKVAVLEHPVVYTDHLGREFLGVVDDTGRYLWANAKAMQQDERVSGKDYVTYVIDQDAPETRVGTFADGEFYLDPAQTQPAATIHTESAENYENIR